MSLYALATRSALSRTWTGLSEVSSKRPARATTALKGVRISWLMLAERERYQ
jgi:hypothetical protein